ncbi:MAG: DUF6471 domain-containing protein [Paludisphaera borealis]|uniref:DUF6471 domain-containing protein n=1 Tax=Paludisphaera borealis TaxID=1387353 RepID=UPI00283D624C|nr:DUF6471 domain-containing protein [Paludisphaera borealis]MDR3620512.1 DUF6471 domain-containing protein [Paludisphaera borealis]
MSDDVAEKVLAEKTGHYLKVELKRANVTYEGLAERLKHIGIHETKASIASKIGRGTFSATFLVATLKAIGKETMVIGDI